jgi:hypothetical protein
LISCDWQQEDGLCASLPLGVTNVLIKRPMSTSSLAIFLPFTSRDLFQIDSPRCSYYGLNTLTPNMIFADKTLLKNPNSLVLGTPGCFTNDTRIQLANNTTISFAELYENGKDVEVKCYDIKMKKIVTAVATDPRISGEVTELTVITLESKDTITCTPKHKILTVNDVYIKAEDLKIGYKLSGGHTVSNVITVPLNKPMKVYDITVPKYENFILDNGVIVHNSGKSFSVKREIADVFLKLEDDILICDPEAEFYPLVTCLHGQVIKLSTTSSNFINPMDIIFDSELIAEEDPIPDKVNFLFSLMELIAGGRFGLKPQELALIDRAAGKIYNKF